MVCVVSALVENSFPYSLYLSNVRMEDATSGVVKKILFEMFSMTSSLLAMVAETSVLQALISFAP